MLALVTGLQENELYSIDLQNPEAVLATVSGETIPAEEFRTRYVDYLLATGLKDELRYRSHFLNTLIAERLLVQEAFEAGIANEARFGAASAKSRKKLLIEAYVQHAVFDTLQVAEEELQDMFVRANTTLTARHLYANTKPEAELLYDRLNQGESFEALALEVFADTALANSGGMIGSFTFDEMDPAFEQAAYALAVGETSAPVKTAQGYSIIQVTDRFTKPLLTEYEYATRRDKMYQYVNRTKRLEARSQLVDDIENSLQPAFNEAALDLLIDQIQGKSIMPVEQEAVQAWEKEVLVSFRIDDQSDLWTLADFRAAASLTSEAQRMRISSRQDLLQFVKGLLIREEMARRSEALELDQSILFIQAQQKAIRTWVWEDAVQQFTAMQEVQEDTLRTYYKAYADEFELPERVRVWEILLNTKREAEEIKSTLKDEAFEVQASQYTLRPGGRQSNGDLGYLTRDQLGLLADAVFASSPSEVLGPLEIAGKYVLLKVGERQPSRQMTLDEAKPEIINQLKSGVVKENMKRKISRLRNQHAVEIDEELLAVLPLKKTND